MAEWSEAMALGGPGLESFVCQEFPLTAVQDATVDCATMT